MISVAKIVTSSVARAESQFRACDCIMDACLLQMRSFVIIVIMYVIKNHIPNAALVV